MMPPGVSSDRLLCILDLSWWLSRAWHIALSKILKGAPSETATAQQHQAAANGTIAEVMGWLAKLLSPPAPACLAMAVDSMGPTVRHTATEGMPEDRRYKAQRPARPMAYHRASNVVLELMQLHAIPILAAEGYEADDAIAAAVARCGHWQGEQAPIGLDAVVVSQDKDHASLVSFGRGVWQWAWGGGEEGVGDVRGWIEIEKKYGVPPPMMPAWLAIVGDVADNIAGADGVGEKWAERILRAQACIFNGDKISPLDGCFALKADMPSDDALAVARSELRKLTAIRVNALSDEGQARHAAKVAEASARLDAIKDARAFARALAKLQAQRERVTLAYELVRLRDDCPIVWRPEELPVGGFDIEGIRAVYRELGFYGLAAEVRTQPKQKLEDIARRT